MSDYPDKADEPINLSRFYELLQDHAQGSVQCKDAEGVMFFGSTGVGKSTMLHLLAGANFSFETVELETSLGTVINRQLKTQMEIPGCMIGHSATSTTQLLNSHYDSSTSLTYIDTPGFNNVGGGDDTTIDAANSAAIMSTIRSCSTLRVVFLISVKDELDTTKAGQIKRLFELMGKFIKNAESHMQSVLMLFTHCAGSNAMHVMDMCKRIVASKALPENLMPFLHRAFSLLNTHQDVLLIDPAAEDAQQRMNQVRKLLKTTVVPIEETEAALQCPLSNEVLLSLENVCRFEMDQIVLSFLNNRLLTDSRSHLDRLRLLHVALGQKELTSIYKSAVSQMVTRAEDRKTLVLQCLQRQSFSQVRSSLSIWGFKCEGNILSSHMSIIERPGDVLETLHNDCILSIISTCEEYDHNLDEALEKDDFDAVVTVLRHSEGMLEQLKEYVPTRRQEMLSFGARNKVRGRTIHNKEKARARIRDKQFDTELCCLLDTIQRSSDKFSDPEWSAINHDQPTENETDCLVEEDYFVVSAEMNTMLTAIAEELKTKFKPGADVSTSIVTAFIEEESSTVAALSQIDSAYDLCSPHIRDDAKEAREACHEALSVLKETSFERLEDAIGNFDWKEASSLFDCMQKAGKLGSQKEKRTVESRLKQMKNSATLNRDKLVESLSADLDRDDFQSFMGREISLGNAIRLPADSELGKALLQDSRSARDRLLSQAKQKFTQAVLKCKKSLKDLEFADVMIGIRMLDKMAEFLSEALSVGREEESGCPVPDFNKRLVELLQHVHSEAKIAVDNCKLLVAPLHDPCNPLQDSTESKVAHLAAHLQPVQELRKQVFKTLKSQIPSLCRIIMNLNPPDPCAHSTAADWDEELFRMLQDAEDHLSGSLQSYARACHDRCLSSLTADPKPLADDIVTFLNTLTNCQKLDPFLASVGPDEGAAGTQPFAERCKSVSDAVKQKFTEVRDAFSRDVRADRMAAAQANLEMANAMQALRDEFARDAITFDAALQEMRSSFEQKSGTFARKFDIALSQERFPELRKLLLGSRHLKGAAEQEEYSSALSKLIEVGDGKHTAAIQIISMISHDARGRTGDFPPSVEHVATSLRWIESARCLSVGEDPILPVEVFEKWQSAFHNMTKKLELLKEGEAKLEEWKFATVEEIHRRLGQLLMLHFPVEISGTIERMQSELIAALDAKVAGLDTDVRNALEKGKHHLLDDIFEQVKIAKDSDSSFVKKKTYTSVDGVMEHFLNDLVESIKGHYMNLEIKEAHSKHKQLRRLQKANVVKPHVEHTGLDALAEQQKSSMITGSWLSEGHVNIVKDKVKGFRDVDPINYKIQVGKFMKSFEDDIQRLQQVDTKTGVIKVRQFVLQIPRFALVLDGEQSAFKKGWEDIWNSFLDSVDRKWRLACATAAGQEHDISDSISFLLEARKLLLQKLLLQNVTGQLPKAGITLPASSSEPKRTSRGRVNRVATLSRDVMRSEPAAGDKRSALDAPDTADDDGCAEQGEGAGAAGPTLEQAGARNKKRNLSQQRQEERKIEKIESEEQTVKAGACSSGLEGRVGHGSGKVGEKRREGPRDEGGGAVGEKLKDKRQKETNHNQEGFRGKGNGKCAGVHEDASAVVATLGFVTTLGFPGSLAVAPTGLSTATPPTICTARFDSLIPFEGGVDVANSEDDFVDAEEEFEETKCAFLLPFDDVQVKTLIEKLDSLLGHIKVDTTQIDADWIQNVEKFDFKTEARSFVEPLNFIRKLKRQAQAIRTCGEYGWGKPTPTPDRAVTKLFVSVAEQVKSLNASRPEECAVVLQNLVRFDTECNSVVDDDFELQQQISNNIKKYRQEAWEWVGKATQEFTEQSTEKYRQAELEHSPKKRQALLYEVRKVMGQHQLLEEKLVERGLKQNNGTDSPLVAKIKSEITGKTERTQGRIRSNCTVEDVAGPIHEIYGAAMDFDNAVILKHAESCIALILQDCRGKSGLGLAEVGTVLERDFAQGPEIVANLKQFAELKRRTFQEMTLGQTAEGTVKEVAKLNNLSESHSEKLLELVEQVYAQYHTILKSRSCHYDLLTIVRNIKSQFETHHRIPALIGGVFAVWSLESKCTPLSAQVVAIVRLLALDDQHALGKIRTIRGLGCITSVLEGWCKLAGRKSTSDGESRIDSSHLAQIKTGQGKSVVLGTLATVLSIVGFSVDCVCYSAYLSKRDQLDFKATFDLFGVSHMVQYGTFSQLSERLVNSEGDVREMTRDLILSSKKMPGARSRKTSGAKEGQKKRILLVDEADVFFSRSFYGETYDAVEHLKIPEITDLQNTAWSMKGDTKSILPALKAMDAYQTLMNKFPDVKDILEGQIDIMIRDLEAWQKGDSTERFRAYKIMDEKVAYKSGVCYNTNITFGYVTLWTYFHEVECKRVPEASLEDHLGLMIKCGQFSYAEIPKRYNLILGVTGTLVPESKCGPHPLGIFEQEIIRDDYKISGMTELPSIYGERNLTFRENEHVRVQKDEDSYNNEISLEVAKAVEGRAVLVFFESEAKLEKWQNSTYGHRVPKGTMECIKSDTRDITMKVRRATHSGHVTLLSREHGRGLDFRCDNKEVDELGGLHVVQTFLSEELSEEIQIRGRTARMKKKGSFQMILLAKDLWKFEISDDEIEQKEKGLYVRVTCECSICLDPFSHGDEIRKLPCNHEFHAKCVDGWVLAGNKTCPYCRRDIHAPVAAATATSGVTQQTMYQFLHEKRAVFLDKSSVTRREAVWCAKALHDQSAAFQRDLLAFSHAPTQMRDKWKDKCLQFLRGRNIVQAKCRLLCLSDATASMSSVWDKTQNSIRTMLERISAISGGSGNIEVKWLAFRDYELERAQVMEASPWTDDPASLVKFVGSIRCRSGPGCDGPEAVEAGLYHANNDPTQQPTRVLLIGDAPPHNERKGQKLDHLTVHASNLEDGGFVAGGVLSTDYLEECTKLKEKEVKVFSFYLNDWAKASFDEIASMTGGESKKLDISDAESLVHAVCETALEDIGGSAMQERYRAQYRAT